VTGTGGETGNTIGDSGRPVVPVYIGLGTNMGDRRCNLKRAVTRLAALLDVERVSDVYESDAVGYTDQPRFWNIALKAVTGLGPVALLNELKRLERELGREETFPMGPRIIDLDILLYSAEQIDQPALRVPHPALMDRPFVLRPLLDLEPALRHPSSGELLADRAAALRVDETLIRLGSAREILHAHDSAH
jgi:2-amino-4-hydroxy-6-hydroxymethyldihydropteridine diphosphokinase